MAGTPPAQKPLRNFLLELISNTMAIWFKPYTLDDLQQMNLHTMGETIGIEFTAIGEDSIQARMPVDHRTVQPARILHGGASAALAETLGSVGCYLTLNTDTHYCVGLELNINHIRAERSGFVTGTARPIHTGRTTHVWGIEITNAEGKLVATSRITMMILEKK